VRSTYDLAAQECPHFQESLRINPDHRWAKTGRESSKSFTIPVPVAILLGLGVL
jgi:hypothetical protein